MDDVLVHGKDQKQHDERLHEVMQKQSDAGLTLNPDKCEYSKSSIKFLGHIISSEGITIDPEKVEAITNFPKPTNITELRRLLGMVNHVAKFAGPNLADKTRALRDLLKKENDWTWDAPQEEAFQYIKKQLSSAPVLAHYSSSRKTRLSTDASSYGLGAVLQQKQDDGIFKPVFYASRSLTPTEQQYAQVEKEALGVAWACEKFREYITGIKDLVIETDHRPLLTLLKTKNLDELSPRLLRFRMRVMRYSFQIEYKKGKDLITADALSRAPVRPAEKEDKQLEEEADSMVDHILSSVPATPSRLEQIRQELSKDPVCSQIQRFVHEGWPEHCPSEKIQPYWSVRHFLSMEQDLLLYGTRLVIPEKMRSDILEKIHTGHQGIVKCRARARESVWWPGLSAQIESMVERCPVCVRERQIPPEPLIPTDTPDYPWQKIGMDLFELKKEQYLIVVDYYSRYIELALLRQTTAECVINHCKSIFSRHGIPEVVMSDNGCQFTSHQFTAFAEKYGFTHITSSPHYPQANGEAERAVQTVKSLMKKAEDPYLALLSYRATPLQQGLSPGELLMGRKLRTTVPILPSTLRRGGQKEKSFQERDRVVKKKQKMNFDRSHRARAAPLLAPGQPVWVKPSGAPGTVVQSFPFRSYEVQTPSGRQRRNRRYLVPRELKPRSPCRVPREANPLIPGSMGGPEEDDPGPETRTLWQPAVTPSSTPNSPQTHQPFPCPFQSPGRDDLVRMPGPQPEDQHDAPVVRTSRRGRPIRRPDRLDL